MSFWLAPLVSRASLSSRLRSARVWCAFRVARSTGPSRAGMRLIMKTVAHPGLTGPSSQADVREEHTSDALTTSQAGSLASSPLFLRPLHHFAQIVRESVDEQLAARCPVRCVPVAHPRRAQTAMTRSTYEPC
jgi:hypothetical protein